MTVHIVSMQEYGGVAIVLSVFSELYLAEAYRDKLVNTDSDAGFFITSKPILREYKEDIPKGILYS